MLKRPETTNEQKNIADDASNRISEMYFAIYIYIYIYIYVCVCVCVCVSLKFAEKSRVS